MVNTVCHVSVNSRARHEQPTQANGQLRLLLQLLATGLFSGPCSAARAALPPCLNLLVCFVGRSVAEYEPLVAHRSFSACPQNSAEPHDARVTGYRPAGCGGRTQENTNNDCEDYREYGLGSSANRMTSTAPANNIECTGTQVGGLFGDS
eukprot:gene4356-14476_t